mmetsp:Transcript_23521/g.68766  ORF Transcript_23521/g.68766 Transcript_23521/m.68766 type:complete len:264 (+) Transcript_23521:353-1144(+)
MQVEELFFFFEKVPDSFVEVHHVVRCVSQGPLHVPEVRLAVPDRGLAWVFLDFLEFASQVPSEAARSMLLCYTVLLVERTKLLKQGEDITAHTNRGVKCFSPSWRQGGNLEAAWQAIVQMVGLVRCAFACGMLSAAHGLVLGAVSAIFVSGWGGLPFLCRGRSHERGLLGLGRRSRSWAARSRWLQWRVRAETSRWRSVHSAPDPAIFRRRWGGIIHRRLLFDAVRIPQGVDGVIRRGDCRGDGSDHADTGVWPDEGVPQDHG